ncbi:MULTISPECIES: hypothetical protein [Rhodococcus]|nr:MULTISPECIES: hypothetical protein [Rhodococcus]
MILIAVVLVSILPLVINGLRARCRGQGAVLQPDSIPTSTGDPGQCARPGAPFTR